MILLLLISLFLLTFEKIEKMNFKNKLDFVLQILPVTYRGLPDVQIRNIEKEINQLGDDKTNVIQYLIDKKFVTSEVINRPNVMSGTVWIKTNLSLRFAQENGNFSIQAKKQRNALILKIFKNTVGVLAVLVLIYMVVKFVFEQF
jgi:hypothetical protein